MPPLFTSFLDFGVRHWEEGKVLLIHCNQGESRAPSLALLFLAKHKREIPNESYADARAAFQLIDPNYQPGRGIQLYLAKHWGEF